MKNIILLVVSFGFVLSAFGQTTDTSFISIHQEEDAFEKHVLLINMIIYLALKK